MPRRCRVGARLSSTGCSRITSSRMSHTSGPSRSTRRLAALMVEASPRSCSFWKMNGLNSSSAIFFGNPHWCRRSCGPTTITEQVLAEAPLLALDHVGERLQRALVGAGDGPAAAPVVEQRIHRFLEHALLVAHDDIGRIELEQPAQAVVAVDDPAVQVVQVAGGETSAIERH